MGFFEVSFWGSLIKDDLCFVLSSMWNEISLCVFSKNISSTITYYVARVFFIII